MEKRVVLVDENDNEIGTIANEGAPLTKNKKKTFTSMDSLFPRRFLKQ